MTEEYDARIRDLEHKLGEARTRLMRTEYRMGLMLEAVRALFEKLKEVSRS